MSQLAKASACAWVTAENGASEDGGDRRRDRHRPSAGHARRLEDRTRVTGPTRRFPWRRFFVADLLGKAADTAIQLCGARGYSSDTVLEWIYRYGRAGRILDGAVRFTAWSWRGPTQKTGMTFGNGVDRDPATVGVPGAEGNRPASVVAIAVVLAGGSPPEETA